MPVAVSFFARQLIIIGVQLGIFAAIERFVVPLLNDAIAAITKAFGVSEATARDILHNEVLTTAEALGLTVALSKARLPLALADKLGFSTRGFSKVKIAADVEAKVARARAGGGFGTVAAKATVDDIAAVVAKSKGILPEKVKAVLGDISLLIGGPLFVLYVTANFLDFGAWSSSAYKGTFRALFEIVGLKPDAEMPSSRVLSKDVWEKIYNTYKLRGAYAINDPFKMSTTAFTTQNLIDLVDKVAANLLAETGKAPAAAVLGNTMAFVLTGVTTTTPSATTVAPSTVSTSSAPSVKIFTGVLSQGTLGSGAAFAARPDDLIQSADELQVAAANNLAALLAALPSSLVYELKIVSSVMSKDGFTQRGTAQQIVSGKYADGSPKYRTVVNKFAVLTVYMLTERGSRTKVRQITLGPTDVVRFNPTTTQLASMETAIKGTINTSDVADIQKIITTAPLAVAALEDAAPQVVTPDPLASIATSPTNFQDTGYRYYRRGDGGAKDYFAMPWAGNIPHGYTPVSEEEYRRVTGDTKQYINSGYTFVNGVVTTIANAELDVRNKELAAAGYLKEIPIGNGVGYIPTGKTASGATAPSAVCAARTLYELSLATGEPLPGVAARSKDYERLGLGSASYYTGTAEQNTKLLAALQKERGCPV